MCCVCARALRGRREQNSPRGSLSSGAGGDLNGHGDLPRCGGARVLGAAGTGSWHGRPWAPSVTSGGGGPEGGQDDLGQGSEQWLALEGGPRTASHVREGAGEDAWKDGRGLVGRLQGVGLGARRL